MQSLFVISRRKKHLMTMSCVFILFVLTGFQDSRAETPSAEEMWEIIQQQQQVIADLKARLDDTDQRVTVNEAKVEEAAEEVEAAAEAFEIAQTSTSGSSWADKTTVGGYGELHYNNREGDDEVDFHRFVLYFGHEFTKHYIFRSYARLLKCLGNLIALTRTYSSHHSLQTEPFSLKLLKFSLVRRPEMKNMGKTLYYSRRSNEKLGTSKRIMGWHV